MLGHLAIFAGPEAWMVVVTAYVFVFCRRHPTGEGKDVAAVEALLMRLPFFAAVPAFATFFIPDLQDWQGIARINVAYFVALVVGSLRLLAAFGTGAKGQDAGFLLIVVLGVVMASIGSTITGAIALADRHAGFASWFDRHGVLGVLLTIVAILPVAVLLMIAATIVLFFAMIVYMAIKKIVG